MRQSGCSLDERRADFCAARDVRGALLEKAPQIRADGQPQCQVSEHSEGGRNREAVMHPRPPTRLNVEDVSESDDECGCC